MNDTSDPAAQAPQAAAGVKASEAIDTRLVRRLDDILKDTGLTTIEVERGDLRIRVAREMVVAPQAPMAVAAAPLAPAPAPASAPAPVEAPAPTVRAGDLVKSPMVGTAYLQAQPGSPAFVKVGDTVHELSLIHI